MVALKKKTQPFATFTDSTRTKPKVRMKVLWERTPQFCQFRIHIFYHSCILGFRHYRMVLLPHRNVWYGNGFKRNVDNEFSHHNLSVDEYPQNKGTEKCLPRCVPEMFTCWWEYTFCLVSPTDTQGHNTALSLL